MYIVFATWATKGIRIKEVKMKLDKEVEIDDKQKEIMSALIRTYTTAQNDIIAKHASRQKTLNRSAYMFIGGLAFLLVFILSVLAPHML